MGLNQYSFQPDYNKAYDDIAAEFYLPCMRSSVLYNRISGYFGSTIYIIAWDAIKEFVANHGHMRLICSPFLSDEDKAAINEGYENKGNEIVLKSIEKEINDLFGSEYLSKPARVLACLVAMNVIEIKIAIPGELNNPDIKRLFHDKAGVFIDAEGNAVGFRGPMNETFKGLSSDGNLESIDVFPSWEGDRDRLRLHRVQEYFEQLWAKTVPGVNVFDFPEASRKRLVTKATGSNWEELVDEISIRLTEADRWKPDKSPSAKKPRPHQLKALKAWEANGRRGILEHATGSGKTFTALCAIRDALDKHEPVVVLVPSTDLLRQWKIELSENIRGLDIDFLLCGDGNNYWKEPGILSSWTRKGGNRNRIVVAVMDTAASDQFLSSVSQGEHLMLVADEVHRLGSEKRRKVFSLQTGARLGLSATPIRYGDPEGTNAIFDYFGGIVPPVFSLEDAIQAKVLTPYFYTPLTMSLSDDEQERWDELTNNIRRALGRFSGSKEKMAAALKSPRIQMMMIARSRIVKNASAKVGLAIDTIDKFYKKGQRWIIYCDNKTQLKEVLSRLLRKGYDAYEYHSEMLGDREQTKAYFSINGGVLVSIRCLDEGVDIPATTHALILASSKNPREFIQRRGRILRRSEGKAFAYLFDAIVTPRKAHDSDDRSVSIIEGELARAIQFGEWAENPSCIAELKLIALDYGIDIEKSKTGGFEADDEE